MKVLPLLKWAAGSVARRGIVRTSKVVGSAVFDFGFDIYWGTETLAWVWTEDLGANSIHDANAVGYRASKARALRILLRKLKLPRDYAFIDLGSGKGRVLLLAAQMGFKKVLGVEFSPKLCAIARANVQRFGWQIKLKSDIEIIESDAADFEIPRERCIFYAFNPFDGVVMEKWLGNLRQSLARSPRKVWLVYNTPIHAGVIENSNLFAKPQNFEIGGALFKVYHS